MKSTIKLFRAVPIKTKRKKTNKDLMKKTIERGFIFAPEVIANYSESELTDLIEEIGLNPKELNSSFHKSWVKVKEASIEQLIIEQIIHYFTTYGFEKLGIYSKDSVYIPREKLDIPEIKIEGFTLIVIKGYTKKELKEKLLNLLGSGIALKEDTIKDVIDVAIFVDVDEKDIKDIKNKEVKSALYDYLNLFPENPVEFLRFVVYKATNKTLLIKNPNLIEEIKGKDNLGVLKLFKDYEKKYGLRKLAEVFYRFKPIFLAFRTNKRLKTITNKIRKLAVKNHKPMPEDYLNSITSKLKNRETINKKRLNEELDKVNIFRKIRLAYALKFRTKDVDSILYKIRNGKGYATEFDFTEKNKARKTLDIVIDSIVKDVGKNVKGKKIYIPDYINYTLPATEKQFTGYFPSGTYVSIPRDMIFGIHWKDVKRNRIDLDLSLLSPEIGKIGWDSDYRTEDGDILFSGDMTEAHNGATELFYVQRQTKKALILFVNYYNFKKEIEVPFKIIVAKEKATDFKMNYMVNPNNLISVAESKINQRQKILGLLISTTNENKFYFTETYLGRSITSYGSDFAENARKYLFNFYENTISLRDILEKSGAKFVEKDKADINLSPEELEKDSILNLLTA